MQAEPLTKLEPRPPLNGLVCVVEDDGPVRRSLERLVRSWGMAVETFCSAQAYLRGHRETGPACLVLDVRMPGLDGIALQELIANHAAQIVFLTGYGDVPTCANAMKAGAVDFLTKPVDEEKLYAAVRSALLRSLEVCDRTAERGLAKRCLGTLTPREVEVMQCVVTGALNKQIADHLGITEKTIKIHRGRVMEKMQVTSVADLVRAAQAAEITPRIF